MTYRHITSKGPMYDASRAKERCTRCGHTFEEHGKSACLQRGCYCGTSRFTLESEHQHDAEPRPRYTGTILRPPQPYPVTTDYRAIVKAPEVGGWSIECPVCGARAGEACKGTPMGTIHNGRLRHIERYAQDLEAAEAQDEVKPPEPNYARSVDCPDCGVVAGEKCIAPITGARMDRVHSHRLQAYQNQPKQTGNNVSTALIVTCPVCDAAPMNGCVNTGDRVHVARVDKAAFYLREQGWLPPEPVEERPKDGPEYYDNTAMLYLRMARNTDRYSRPERLEFALKAAELLMQAEERS